MGILRELNVCGSFGGGVGFFKYGFFLGCVELAFLGNLVGVLGCVWGVEGWISGS